MAKPLSRSRSFRALKLNSDSPKETAQPAPRRLQKQQRPREISPIQDRNITNDSQPRKPLMRSRSQTKKDQPHMVNSSPRNEAHYPGINPLGSHTSSMFFAPMPQAAAEPPPYASCDEMAIGMALGSPRDNPQWSFEAQLPVTSHDNDNDSRTTVSSPAPSQNPSDRCHGGPTLKHKGSRWKVLGGMFGKKATESPPPPSFYQVQQSSSSPRTPQAHTPKPNKVSRERSIKKRINPKNKDRGEGKPIFNRAQTVPLAQAEATPRPPPKSTQSSLRPGQFHLGGTRMLDVDIPNTKLDRYSVMFDAVLKPDLPTAQPQSSLLARRQANVGSLKPLYGTGTDNMSNDEYLRSTRPATSPSPTKAPSFHLLLSDSVGSTRNPSPTPSILRRAVTAPCAISPLRNTFDPTKTPESESKIILMVHSPAQETYETPPRILKRNPSYDRSLPSSPQSFDTAESYFPDIGKEPAWEMLATPGEKTLPRSPGSAGAEAEALINSAAEISIARQISVSQRQRLLLPVIPSAERVIDRQPKMGELRMGNSRKSHHLEIQSA
ncbi:MAG: hypothetical protein M1812_002496 [Candelaria pacifica]|nr:MAG: hypothetical protein M1812_002496 [Candelaria pacifica]